jgi:bifunctional non-homologous end joining protein LigD
MARAAPPPSAADGREMSLQRYRRKRDFEVTSEPRGRRAARSGERRFVIQKHAARRLHYDFRLELDGVLKSWAVPKGPSLDPEQKRLAVEVEDHPLDYADFEGRIPKGQYGAGTVEQWDSGTWTAERGVHAMFEKGDLTFELHGRRLRGLWKLVRMRGREDEGKNVWLLIKVRDAFARANGEADADAIAAATPANGVARRAARAEARVASRRSSAPARAAAPAGRREPAVHDHRLPPWKPPQLATLAAVAPDGDQWLHEIKYDGYRVSARLANGEARLITRGGKDWTERFSMIAEEVERLTPRSIILDGEVVVVDDEGVTHFQALQNALDRGRDHDLLYYVFDLLYLDGRDLARAPLEERKRELAVLLAKLPRNSPVRYSDHVIGQGPRFHAEACRRRLEGIVSKLRDRPGVTTRSRDWIKVKCSARQELVIGGFTAPRGARAGFGALLLGVPAERGLLRYAGRVGTGFDSRLLESLHARLLELRAERTPFLDPPRERDVTWVKPELVAEVEFTEWTNDGRLRHPSFQGLREDKSASEVVVERPDRRPLASPRSRDRAPAPARPVPDERATARGSVPRRAGIAPGRNGSSTIAGISLTHPDRVLYPDEKLTKSDLARYLARVAERMLPHVADRPLMLMRCQDGVGAPCFFQKHPSPGMSDAIHRVEIAEGSGPDTYLVVRDAAGLVALVQSGAIEIHTWGARTRTLEKPDLMVIDLDPGPDVEWSRVVDTAKRVKRALEGWDLVPFVKTTGGKGLHLTVPLQPRHDWDQVKGASAAIARALVRETPDQLTGMISKSRRQGKIFLDTLRNGRGSTFIAPWSARARARATVAMPLPWSALTARLDPTKYTLHSLLTGRLAPDPWAGMDEHRARLPAALLRSVPA